MSTTTKQFVLEFFFYVSQLCNYQGPARITVSLVTCDDVTPPKIHAHELINKNCRNGVYLKELDSNGDLEVQ